MPTRDSATIVPLLSETAARRHLQKTGVGVLRLGPDARISGANSRLCGLLQYEPAQLQNRLLQDLCAPASAARFSEAMFWLRERGHLRSSDLQLVRQDGGVMLFDFRLLGLLPDHHRLIECSFRRIETPPAPTAATAAEPAHRQLPRQPRHFEQLADRALEQVRQDGQPLSLLSILIDRVDKTTLPPDSSLWFPLPQFAEVCSSSLRSTDSIGKVSDMAFVILLPGALAKGALRAAERLRCRIAATGMPSAAGKPRPVTVSIGVVTTRTGRTSYRALRSRADAKRDDARSSGGNRVVT